MANKPGQQYGRYILEDRIAMGGMAEIFRARTANEGFEKRVCIKRILPHFLDPDSAEGVEFETMFRDEARTAAKLQHANVVQVFDFGEQDGTLFLAMEFVDGADLRRIGDAAKRKRAQLLIGEVLQIGIDVCRGLHHAHQLGTVHRDVSPHNILVSKQGEVKVTDFGIARAAERATHTSTGIVKGKVAYMSPEQAQGLPFDHRLDQFALGAVLWESLCGMRLFQGENDAIILKKVLACDVPVPSSIRSDVPKALDDVVLTALSKEPSARFPDMRQMELALQRVLFSGVDPSTADVRNIFTRIMEGESAALRKTQIAEPMPPAQELTESSDVSLVFTKSDKRQKTPLSDDGKPVGDPVLNPASSGKNAKSSPPLALSSTALPTLEELERAEKRPDDGTPATRTNVPAGAKPALVAPVVVEPVVVVEPPVRSRTPLFAGTAGAVVVAGLLVFAVTHHGDPTTTSGGTPPPPSSTTPGATASTTPGATASTTPGATASTTPGATASTTPGATASTTPGATPSTTPGATPSTTPGATPSTTPGATPSTTPGATASPASTGEASAAPASTDPAQTGTAASTGAAHAAPGSTDPTQTGTVASTGEAHAAPAPTEPGTAASTGEAHAPSTAASTGTAHAAPASTDPSKTATAASTGTAHAPLASTDPSKTAKAKAKKIRVFVSATKKRGMVLVDGEYRDVTKDGVYLELPVGRQTLKTKLVDDTPRTVSVEVEAGKPIQISFE